MGDVLIVVFGFRKREAYKTLKDCKDLQTLIRLADKISVCFNDNKQIGKTIKQFKRNNLKHIIRKWD